MANILLTTNCNRQCKYCFAKEKMESLGNHEMSMDNIKKIIAFLKKSNFPIFQVMGGEPTLHSQFDQIIKMALNEGMMINLLSNATWGEDKNKFFQTISPDYLKFLLNIDHPDTYSPDIWNNIENNLSYLDNRRGVTLSFNIFEKEPRYEYVFYLASKYNIKNIRLSFSMPVVSKDKVVKNLSLNIEEYKELAPFIMKFTREAEDKNIKVVMDNTIPICMLTMGEVGELFLRETLDTVTSFKCAPIIDIAPDLSLWRCFGTSQWFNKKLDDFNTLDEIKCYYQDKFDYYQNKVFPMKECYGCKYALEGRCQGGCIGYSILADNGNGLKQEHLNTDMFLKSILTIAKDVKIHKYTYPFETYKMSKDDKKEITLTPPIKSLFDLFDGRLTVNEVINRYINKNSFKTNKDDILDNYLGMTLEERNINLLQECFKQGFLELV